MKYGFIRFSRARGTSLFARAFNKELPKCFTGNLSIPAFGEKHLNGFAEQNRKGLLPLLQLDSQDDAVVCCLDALALGRVQMDLLLISSILSKGGNHQEA